jgi:hypothetical protein
MTILLLKVHSALRLIKRAMQLRIAVIDELKSAQMELGKKRSLLPL